LRTKIFEGYFALQSEICGLESAKRVEPGRAARPNHVASNALFNALFNAL